MLKLELTTDEYLLIKQSMRELFMQTREPDVSDKLLDLAKKIERQSGECWWGWGDTSVKNEETGR